MRALLLALILTGCVTVAHERPMPLDGGFPTPEARMLACLDIQDHIIDLYAADYLLQHSAELSSDQATTFRQTWGEQLARGGAFDKFESRCAVTLTESGFRCALRAGSPRDVTGCLNAYDEKPLVFTQHPRQTG